jgi:hypothetical protein
MAPLLLIASLCIVADAASSISFGFEGQAQCEARAAGETAR